MILLDTNILLRQAHSVHPMHQLAEDAVAELLRRGEELCIVPQSLYEFWVVATRPVAQNGLGFTIPETQTAFSRFLASIRLLEDVPAIFPEWERLVVAHSVIGKLAHDTRLVAAMNVHGVPFILTFNDADFRRFPITVLTPGAVLATPPGP